MSEHLTMLKADELRAKGWEPTGVVLARSVNGYVEHVIVDQGAVRSLDREDFWELMHPTPEPTIPKDAERYTGGPEGTNWVKGWATKFWGMKYE